jgi:hypothetical protein
VRCWRGPANYPCLVSVSSFRDWLDEHPPPDAAFGQSLAGVAGRVLDGADFFVATRELLDEFVLLMTDAQRRRAIEPEPRETGDRRYDAYLGALGEHLALTSGLERPEWTLAKRRFLDTFWFQSNVVGFRALAIAESPAAFRRRGIFVAAGSLTRV